MLFNSFVFFIFLPATVVLYYTLLRRSEGNVAIALLVVQLQPRSMQAAIARYTLCCPSDYQGVARRIIGVAAAHDVGVTLITSPYHAEYLEVLHGAGTVAYADEWLRDLAEISQKSQARYPGINVVTWNFFGYSGLAAEALPPANSGSVRMQNFYELGYFTPRFGDRIVAEIQGREFSEGVGSQITPDTVEEVIAGIHADRQMYLGRRTDEPDLRADWIALALRGITATILDSPVTVLKIKTTSVLSSCDSVF
jgi:hypothetical protein